MCLRCLKFGLSVVWIYIYVCLNGLVPGIIKTSSKIALIIGFVAVIFVHIKLWYFLLYSANYHISAIFAVYLDGRLHALSFDMLQATFLNFSSFSANVSQKKCDMCHILFKTCQLISKKQ